MLVDNSPMELSDETLAKLLQRFGSSVAAGQAIYAEGDVADHLYIVHSGRVRSVRRYQASERSLTVLRDGDLFGEEAFLGPGVHRTAAAVALTDVELIGMDRDSFAEWLASEPTLARQTVALLVRRVRDLDEQLENTHLQDHGCRVVNTMLRLAARVPATAQGHTLQLSPLELSSRVGLDVDAVKRAIQRLRDGGYVRIRDEKIVLPDLAALRHLYELLSAKEEMRRGSF